MKLTWLGHSCFTVESKGYRVVLDPYYVETYPPLRVEAEKVLCSHTHRDHAFREAVTLTDDGREDPFTIETLSTFHDEVGGAKRGENTIHILRAEGKTVVHCGDLGHELNDRQLARIKNCDVLLLPIGGYYTVDAQTAKRIADAVQPRITVPMHYRFGAHGFDEIGTVEDFLALYEGGDVRLLSENSFLLEKDTPRGVIVPRFVE